MSSCTALTHDNRSHSSTSLVSLFSNASVLSNYIATYGTTALVSVMMVFLKASSCHRQDQADRAKICGESWDRTGQDGVRKASHISVPVTVHARDGKMRLTLEAVEQVKQEVGR
jgi:hypothetical protein